jgi:four helix bundle protein
MKTYTDLNVWIKARELCSLVYLMTKKFPQEEYFGLITQMRRAAVSVVSNLAEGCGRNHKKDSIQLFYIARGSLYELETQCYLSYDQKYLLQPDYELLLSEISVCKRLLSGFVIYYEKLLN